MGIVVARPVVAPPPIDYRIERCIKNFEIPMDKIEELWLIFLKYDREKKGMVTMQDFLANIIKFPSSPLTDSMLKLIDSKSDGFITFGEFVELICTFCCFEQMELLRYVFYILDSTRSGLIKKDELKHMILIMHGHEMNGTIREASNYLDSIDTGYGVFNFQQFATMRGKYPAVFQPVYALQTHMKQHSLGLFWWNLHKVNFHEAKQEEAERLAITMMKEQKEKERAEEMLNELMLKKRMGILYYLLPWERAKEMRKMQRIVAIEKELDA